MVVCVMLLRRASPITLRCGPVRSEQQEELLRIQSSGEAECVSRRVHVCIAHPTISRPRRHVD
ncbi:hypothetical protein PMIN01_04041 [Paraphaeosphaeria minitans]|uniref:Uncharacterized protein n=1 Tax=Paraphaeosphaeria minitans TaxID=565426 RepID=A0A9P6KTD9_9PLEO|nr:hypothetical protein PMIN01_04041 [Paraphaeosphaeria minitans]